MKRFVFLLAAFFFVFPGVEAEWGDGGYPFPVPLGLPPPPVPEDNPVTEAKVALGHALFFDTRLSRDGTVSCATCHNPATGWAERRSVSVGVRGQKGARNAPTVLNTAYLEAQFLDGRAATLEEQAGGPIENPVEMDMPHDLAVERVRGIKGYRPLFDKAFGEGEEITIERMSQALAAFERTALSGNAPYDRFAAGDGDAMSEPAVRGMGLFFGKADCAVCHTGFNFTDSDFHNLGVGMKAEKPDLGRYEISKKEKDKGAFRTPTLRNLKHTGPYMHDGSMDDLRQVIALYNKGGEKNPWLSDKMKPLRLSAREKDDLLAFMEALNGDEARVESPELPE